MVIAYMYGAIYYLFIYLMDLMTRELKAGSIIHIFMI
jgi:hypothetical protein